MRKVGIIRICLAFILLFAGIWLTWQKATELKWPLKMASLPVKYVRIEGVLQNLSKEELEDALLPWVSVGFLEADMQSIHNAVAALPWVGSVAVTRLWPDTLDIKVIERKPYLRWGKDGFITEQGVIFKPKSVAGHEQLPILNTQEARRLEALDILKGLSLALADQGLVLKELTINDRGAWSLKLAYGPMIMLGREEQVKKLQRFLRTLPLLEEHQIAAMAVVDLRYPNGYAVAWKASAPILGELPASQADTVPPAAANRHFQER